MPQQQTISNAIPTGFSLIQELPEDRVKAIIAAHKADTSPDIKIRLIPLIGSFLKARSYRDQLGMLIEIQGMDALGYHHLADVLQSHYEEQYCR